MRVLVLLAAGVLALLPSTESYPKDVEGVASPNSIGMSASDPEFGRPILLESPLRGLLSTFGNAQDQHLSKQNAPTHLEGLRSLKRDAAGGLRRFETVSASSTASSGTIRSDIARAKDIVNAADYGVKCDGSSINDAAFSKFADAMQATVSAFSGAQGVIPNGTGACLISRPINFYGSSMTIRGGGAGVTTIQQVTANTDAVWFCNAGAKGAVPCTSSTTQFYEAADNSLSGIRVTNTAQSASPSAGAGIRVTRQLDFSANHLDSREFFVSYLIEGGSAQYWNALTAGAGVNFSTQAVTAGSAFMRFAVAARAASENAGPFEWIANFNLTEFDMHGYIAPNSASPQIETGFDVQGSDGIYIGIGHIGFDKQDLRTLPTADGLPIDSVHFTDVYFDGNNSPGTTAISVPPSSYAGGAIADIKVLGGIIANHLAGGVTVENPVFVGEFLNVGTANERGSCMKVTAATALDIEGTDFGTCGYGNGDGRTFPGVSLSNIVSLNVFNSSFGTPKSSPNGTAACLLLSGNAQQAIRNNVYQPSCKTGIFDNALQRRDWTLEATQKASSVPATFTSDTQTPIIQPEPTPSNLQVCLSNDGTEMGVSGHVVGRSYTRLGHFVSYDFEGLLYRSGFTSWKTSRLTQLNAGGELTLSVVAANPDCLTIAFNDRNGDAYQLRAVLQGVPTP